MRRACAVLVLVALLAAATPAIASRPATAGEKRKITAALKIALKGEGSPAVHTAHVFGIRISTEDGHWALANLRARNADDAYAALVRRKGQWLVRSLGTAQVQCGIGVPVAVMNELFADYGAANCD